MAIVHVATVGMVPIGPTGQVVNKSLSTTTIGMVASASSKHRVLPDPDAPSSADYPTIKEYLIAEYLLGFKLVHMDQYYIITDNA